jgi:hypothetical protein
MTTPNINKYEQLGLTKNEYETYFMNEIKFIQNKNTQTTIEDKFHANITYTSEKAFIDFNLSKLQYFLSIPNIKPMGKYSVEIISDILYRSIPNISRNIINEIMKCYKIIDVKEVHAKFTKRYGDYNNDDNA